MQPPRAASMRTSLAVAGAMLAAGGATVLALGHRAVASAGSATTGVVVVDTTLGYEGGRAAGTGMVLTPSGEVLTNNHVIQGATSIRVVVPQTGRSYAATVVGYDVAADTALLRLRGASGLATVSAAPASTLARGQAVRAVGNAGGTGRLTVATGRVTGLGRTITASDGQGRSERLRGLIEASANVQPGDSGGPLLDSSGRVVGMDTAASVAGGGFYYRTAPNDGYAIPVARALAVVRQIEAGSSSAAVHVGGTAFLGVQVASPGYGYGGSAGGAVVAGVVPGSPADGAGLVSGDVIAAVAGHAVATPDAVVSLLLRRHPGDRVAVTWLDAFGTRRTATVTLAAGPPQ